MVDYCSVADVKPVLHIDLAETSEDAELASCIATGSGLVDGLLKAAGLAVPSSVPQLILDATKFFAAWAYRRVRDPASAAGFWSDAQQCIQTYVESETTPYVGSA